MTPDGLGRVPAVGIDVEIRIQRFQSRTDQLDLFVAKSDWLCRECDWNTLTSRSASAASD